MAFYVKANIVSVVHSELKGEPTSFEYPPLWLENAHKINIRAYHEDKDGHWDYCIAEIGDDQPALVAALVGTGEVIELVAGDAEALITQIRPPKPDVRVEVLRSVSQTDLSLIGDIESLIIGKGHTIRVEEI